MPLQLEPRTFGRVRPTFDVTNRIARIWYLRQVYWRLVTRGLYKIGCVELVRTQFPYHLPDAALPPSLNVEFTNHCQLRCTYCTSPLKLRPQGMMTAATFEALLTQLRKYRIRRVRVVGNGEPTLHRAFPSMIRALASTTRYLELKSNWQHVTGEIVDATLASVDALRVSVDGSTKEDYEALRIGASFDTLVENLKHTVRRQRTLQGKALIMITVMLRPSDRDREARILDFWRPYCDVVSKQYVLDMATGESDSYVAACAGAFPRCSFPFKELKILWNGNVPLCKYSHIQTHDQIGLILGNIRSSGLDELWTHDIMNQYREGHRKRAPELMPICTGCIGT